jgi:hypothetical protein
MSISLVERLRNNDRGWVHPGIAEEAADEIERLRAIADTTDIMTAQAIKRQNDEIERLRAALEQAPRPSPEPSADWMVGYMDWFFQPRIAALTAAKRGEA